MNVLIVNVGSTSLKFRLFELGVEERERAAGRLEGIGSAQSPYKMEAITGRKEEGSAHWPDFGAALEAALRFLTQGADAPLARPEDLNAVGFKCVHAGAHFKGAHVLNDEVMAAMEEAIPLAPVHNPPYIAAIRAVAKALPHALLGGLFEPAFHTTISDAAACYAIPHDWEEKFGFRRIGFHGASHRYIAERMVCLLGRASAEGLRFISCHLGGSSSITAIRDGKSVDHSFGYTAQSGLPHGSRTGDLDPFIPLFLIMKHGWKPEEVARALTKDSGLKGLSGVSSEFREVESAAQAGNPRAQLAVDVFVHQVRRCIGAFVAILEGVDALVFTGGIGERSATTRDRICHGLGCLGLNLDPEKNRHAPAEGPIHAQNSAAQIWVVPTNEEIIVARAVAELGGG